MVQASSEYTPNDAFDLGKMYGVQNFNRKFVYNSYMVWQDPYFKGQRGFLGRAAGGWSIAPLMTAANGQPVYCGTQTEAQSFGSADGANYFSNEQCVFTSKYTGHSASHYGITGSNGIGTSVVGSTTGQEINMFKDPASIWNQVRAPILGIDTRTPVRVQSLVCPTERGYERAEKLQSLRINQHHAGYDLHQRLQPQRSLRWRNGPLQPRRLGR